MIKVVPYKLGSRSAKALAQGLRALRIRSPNYRQKRRDTLINWGASQHSSLIHTTLNPASAVRVATNKLLTLNAFKVANIPCPEFTSDRAVAEAWLAEGKKVVCRTILNGHSGRGIIVVKPGESLPHAPLYTRYFKKDQEYRVHVARDRVFDIAQKKLKNGASINPAHNPYIRNHDNGWVFARCAISPPQTVLDAGIASIRALGLDFGAVDVGTRETLSGLKVAVFEVNTAPGLEGSTLMNYVDAIRKLCYNGR